MSDRTRSPRDEPAARQLVRTFLPRSYHGGPPDMVPEKHYNLEWSDKCILGNVYLRTLRTNLGNLECS
ncbi:hypothetical protein WJX77_008611 [Trebouxia sp. C0004]